MKHLFLLGIGVLCAGSCKALPGQRVDDRVVVVVNDAPIRVGGEIGYRVYKGHVLTVRETHGDWISFASGKPGEIQKQHVIPLNRALEHFDDLVRHEPSEPSFYYARGRVFLALDQPDKAIADFEQTLRLDPKHARASNYRGNAWLDKRQLDKAIADYNQAIRLDSTYAVPYLNRGLAQHRKGNLAEAIEGYTQAIRLDPQLSLAYWNRAEVWLDKGEDHKAIADYTEAARIDPKDWQVWASRGLAWLDQDETAKGIKDLNEAIRIRSDNSFLFRLRGSAWGDAGNYNQAIADFNEAIRLDPHNAITYRHRGNAWYDQDKYEQAIADFSKAINIDPAYAAAYQNRGNVWYNLARYEKALADYGKAIELTPKDAHAYNGRGNVLLKTGDVSRAIEDFNTAVRLDPEYVVGYYNLGRAWMEKHDPDQALRFYNKVNRLDPDYKPIYFARGFARHRKGDLKAAIRDYNEALRRDPQDVMAVLQRGFASLALDDYLQAKSDLARAIELDPRLQDWVQQRILGDEPYHAVDANQQFARHPVATEPLPVEALDVPRAEDLAAEEQAGFVDDFAEDTRRNYHPQGIVEWDKGAITMKPNSVLSRRLRTGSPVAWTVDLDFTPVSGKPVETELILYLRNGIYVYIALRRVKSGAGLSGSIEIHQGHFDSSAGRHTRQLLRQYRLKDDLQSGVWTMRYHYGLVQVFCQDRPLAVGYVGVGPRGFSAECGAVAFMQGQGSVRCRKMELSARAPSPAPDYQARLDSLYYKQRGSVAASQARIAEALEFLEKDVQLLQRTYGEQHPFTVSAYSMFADVYSVAKDAKAIRYMDETIARSKEVFGNEHPETAKIMKRAAETRVSYGDHATALVLYERAMNVYRQVFGTPSLQMAEVLVGIGDVYRARDEFVEAEKYYERALSAYQRITGGDSVHLLAVLARLGTIHAENDNREKAGEFLTKVHLLLGKVEPSSERRQAVYGKIWEMIRELGAMSVRGRDYVSAEQFFQQALTIGRMLPNRSQYELLNQLDLGMLKSQQDKFSEARQHLRTALATGRKLYGEKTFNVTHIIATIGESYLIEKDYGRAREHLEKAFNLELQLAADMLPIVSEVESLQFVGQIQMSRDQLLRAFQELSDVPAGEAYQVVWRSQGLATRTLLDRKRLYFEDDSKRDELDQLRNVRKRLAELTLARVAAVNETARNRQLAELSQQKEQLERNLARSSGAFRHLQQVREATIADVVGQFGVSTGLVHLLKSKSWHDGPEEVYHAFVLRRQKNEPGGYSVRWVRLGDAKPIDRAIAQWHELIARKRGGLVRGFEPRAQEADATDGVPPQYRLRRLVWEPIEVHLDSCSQVVVIPDAGLTRLPWSALPGSKQGSYLLEQYLISTASHASQLIASCQQHRTAPEFALVVGGVKYDSPATPAIRGQTESNRPGTIPTTSRRPRWDFLPGTLREAKRVHLLASESGNSTILHGSHATGAALRVHLPRARYAHLATHGFFADAQFRSVFQLYGRRDGRSLVTGRNPLVLSGLVLAGANIEPATDESGLPVGGDGILTAEETVDLDLRGTELVVLSACDTALGDVAGGEGVLGLQRAFHFAGANSVIASLWKVDDRATQTLMALFYRNLWDRKKQMGKLESLRQAQIAMLKRYDPKDKKLHPRGFKPKGQDELKGNSPYFWGAFVLSGDGR